MSEAEKQELRDAVARVGTQDVALGAALSLVVERLIVLSGERVELVPAAAAEEQSV